MDILKGKREDLIDKQDEYAGLVEIAESRHLTPEERKKEKNLHSEIRLLQQDVKELESNENRLKNLARLKMDNVISDFDEDGISSQYFQIKKSVPVDRARPVSDFVLRNYDVDETMQKVNVYSVIAGLAGRQYKPGSPTDFALGEIRKSGLTNDALLNPYLSAQLIDGGMSKSRLAQAGMKVFNMLEGEHKFAKIDTYPTFEWKAPLASTTERTTVFSSVTFDAKTLRGWIEIPGETLVNAHNIESILQNVFSKAMGNGIDSAGLFGAGGADEPLGITNYVGVPTFAWSDPLDNYDWLVHAQKLVHLEDGPDLTASIMSPDAWSQLVRMKGTAEFQPVPPPFFFENHKFLQTSKSLQTLGTGTQSEIVVGGFSSLNLGVRLQVKLIMTPVIAETFSYKMLAVFMGDFQPDRVEDFAVVTNVDTAPAIT